MARTPSDKAAKSDMRPATVEARLLEAADRLFYAQGYTATGINQIIKEANVAKASFYQHFPTKQALALAYLRQRDEAWFRRLNATVEAPASPMSKLTALFDFLDRWLPESDYRGCAFLNMASERSALGPDADNAIKAHKDRLRRLIARLTRDALGADRAALSDTIFVLFEGALIEAQVMRQTWPIDTARKAALSLLRAPDNG